MNAVYAMVEAMSDANDDGVVHRVRFGTHGSTNKTTLVAWKPENAHSTIGSTALPATTTTMRVKKDTSVKQLAHAVSRAFLAGSGNVVLRSIGKGACNQSVKAIAALEGTLSVAFTVRKAEVPTCGACEICLDAWVTDDRDVVVCTTLPSSTSWADDEAEESANDTALAV